MSRYLRILRRRATLLPFVAAVVGRLPIAMGPLGMVLLIKQVRGSYSIAGAVTAVFAVSTAATTPVWGRLLDRLGQPRVIGPTAVVSALLLAALALAAVNGGGDPLLFALAAGVGLTFPALGPAMRVAWRVVLPSEADRLAAYALDAAAVETIFVGGPLLLSVLLVVAPPAVPLLVTAALLAAGGLAYGTTHAARAWRPQPHELGAGSRGRSPLRSRGMPMLLSVALLMAVGFGQTDVSIAATARETLGAQSKIGLLFAAIAGGSAAGGLWYGSRSWRRSERARLPVVLAAFGTGLATLYVVLAAHSPALPLLLTLLFLTGVSIAPALIIQANLVDRLAARDRHSEAQAWLNTAFASGAAAGTALGGIVVDLGGPSASFLGAALAVAVACAGSLAGQFQWRGSPPSAALDSSAAVAPVNR